MEPPPPIDSLIWTPIEGDTFRSLILKCISYIHSSTLPLLLKKNKLHNSLFELTNQLSNSSSASLFEQKGPPSGEGKHDRESEEGNTDLNMLNITIEEFIIGNLVSHHDGWKL